MDGPQILIIDDDEQLCKFLDQCVSSWGMTAQIIRNPLLVADEIQKNFYNLILLDVFMPDINGMDLLPRIAELSPASKVVIMTGYPDKEIAIKALRVGAVDFLEKPFTVHLFSHVVKRVLDTQRVELGYKRVHEELQRSQEELVSRTSQLETLNGKLTATNASLLAEIAERRQAEEDLRHSQTRLLNLAMHLQDRQEEERQHIAREFHDEMGQGLTILKMDVAWLAKRLRTLPQAWQDRLAAMTTQIDGLVRTVRRISTALRPEILDDLGLTAAIEWQLEEVKQRTSLAYTLLLPTQEVVVEPMCATAVFRIFQEALTNVLRHAEATAVTVRVTQDPEVLLLEVVDNGEGISPDRLANGTALGLLNMRERAQLWDGDVAIQGEQGVGTTVTVRMPCGFSGMKGTS